MKNLLTIISVSIFLFSCSEKETVSTGLEGVWKKIGTTIYKDGKPSDTLSPMYDRTNKKDREGYQYKIYSKEHISWIRRINNLDSAGNNLSYGTGASGTYEVRNDSLFEILKLGVDRWKEIFTEGRVFKFALNINQNNFEQFRIDDQGNGFGELYERIDTYNQSNFLSGVYQRDANLVYENNKVVDTLRNFQTRYSDYSMKLILTDNFYSLIWNYELLDSLGNDTNDALMILANATYENNKQYLSLVGGFKPITDQWRDKFDNKRDRDIELTKENNLLLGLLGGNNSGSLDENGNGRRSLFKRIE